MIHTALYKHYKVNPQNSPRQLAIVEGFAEANSVFIATISAKNVAEVIIS